MLLDAYATRWLPGHTAGLRPRTRQGYADAYRLYIRPMLGDQDLLTITRRLIRDWLAILAGRGLAPATRSLARAVLGIILEGACEEGLLAVNPAAGMRLSAAPVRDQFALDESSLDRLLAVAATHRADLRPILACCGLAGLRIGETLGLQVQDIDCRKREVHVRRSVLQDGTVNPSPKGKRSRVVAMPAALAVILDPWLPACVLWVFPGHDGAPRRYTAVWQALQRIAHQAGLPPFGTHTLRRSHGSILTAKGASAEFVKRQLGHVSLAETGKYTRFLPVPPPSWFAPGD